MDNDNDELYLASITDDMWEAKIDIRSLPIFKTLVKEVKDVYDAKNRLYETYINDYVDTLLHNMHFHSYPLHINAQRRYEIKIRNDDVTVVAIPDFVVTSYESKMMIIIEEFRAEGEGMSIDCSLRSQLHNGNRWKEDQVMAEIFVAAHNLKITDAQDIYAVRIIGTLFTFYKATITDDYIRETLRGYPIKEHMHVLRFPEPGDNLYSINALDFCKSEQRKVIIRYLSRIKQSMQSIIQIEKLSAF